MIRNSMTVVLVIAASGVALCKASDGPNVPVAVVKALEQKFNLVNPSNWVVDVEDGTKVYATRWHDKDGVMHEADFDSSGKVVLTARSVTSAGLPKPVLAAIEKEFVGAQIREAKFREGKIAEYEVRITAADSKKKLLVISPDGASLTPFDE